MLIIEEVDERESSNSLKEQMPQNIGQAEIPGFYYSQSEQIEKLESEIRAWVQ